MLHIARILSVSLVASFMLSGCVGGMHPQSVYGSNGKIIREDINTQRAVEVYDIAPKDTSYVNLEPRIDHDVVQNDDVEVYDLQQRNARMSHSKRIETQSKERWTTLISMWRGGLNIGPSLYADEKKTYNE
jgi:PBP1b-binding outer membrane lipoprotein LpoB|tara:strand:- start:111424 stop:111816 length:393 start_codon:yes stop_codon:yes gene_type:complete